MWLINFNDKMRDFIFSTQHFGIALSGDQSYFGRLYIILLRTETSFAHLTEEEQRDMFMIIKKLETFFKDTYNATMFNYSCLMNDAYKDGETPQVHIHFRPRYQNPIMVHNEEMRDPNFGYHYIPTAMGIRKEISKKQVLDLGNKLAIYFK